MKAIGITGSFAAGKSFLLNYLAGAGYKTFSADEFVSNLYKDDIIKHKILNILPTLKIFDKAKIAYIIYNNEEERKNLQRFIHPFVVKAIKNFKSENKEKNFIFAEVPLLFESNFEQYFDFIITTYCSEESRLERAKSRKGFNMDIYKRIEQIQLPQNVKLKKSDFIINSEVKLVEFEIQIENLLEKLKCLS